MRYNPTRQEDILRAQKTKEYMYFLCLTDVNLLSFVAITDREKALVAKALKARQLRSIV